MEAYQPVVPDHWVFDGVECPPEGITGGADTPVIGYETDGVRLARASDPPRLSEHRKGGGGGRVLLALAKLSAGWVAGYDEANAAMMIRTAPSGGMVFSVGTTDWPLALAAERPVGRITENVISRLHSAPCRSTARSAPRAVHRRGRDGRRRPGRGWYVDGGQSAARGLSESRWSVTGGTLQAGASPAQMPHHVTSTASSG